MANRKSLRPAGWTWADNLSHDLGVQVGDTIWVSGRIALDPQGTLVGQRHGTFTPIGPAGSTGGN
jgi:enamine deaminase RidA (YjgF/YER057c/UK114 family)